jgi:ATP-dependent Lon protease
MKMPGKGNLLLTGKLGEVMQESAKAALSYIRSNFEKFGIEDKFYECYDLHIHIPEGAVPKDGPSAGITMVSSLYSVLTDKCAKKGIALTGEVTLTGKVLAVGGIKTKLLAAHRSGIKTVVIPEENIADLDDVPKNILDALEIKKVNNMEEVLGILF